MTASVGDIVTCFDPRTVGVTRVGKVIAVVEGGFQVDFGLTGTAAVIQRHVVANHGPRT